MKKHVLALGVLLSACGLVSAQTEKGTKMLGVGLSYDSKNNIHNIQYTLQSLYDYAIPATAAKVNSHYKKRYINTVIDFSAGYFIAKNLQVGAQANIGFSQNSTKSNNDLYYLNYNTTGYSNSSIKNNITTSSVGLFGRYYFPIKEGKWYAFGQLSGLYSLNKVKYTGDFTSQNHIIWDSDSSTVHYISFSDSYTQKYKFTNLVIQADAGIAYFISPNFSVETSVLNARYIKQKTRDFEGYSSSTKPQELELWEYGAFLNLNLAVKYFFK